jgi:hypothetical protein
MAVWFAGTPEEMDRLGQIGAQIGQIGGGA